MKAYLLLYNATCGLGWAFCVVRAAQMLLAGATYGQIYGEIGQVLMISQTAMLLEILHSLLGLVPSPVVTVAIQVSSRIFIVWGQLYWSVDCQRHWSLLLIVFSWGITEVVRYLFYFFGLLGGVPYPIFFLRYSMFLVLYPTGISGEIFQTLIAMGAHWKFANPLWYRLSLITLLLYIPAGPGMILNMIGNRRRSFKKRNGAKEEPQGIVWPKDKKGERSSTGTNRAILAASAAAGPNGGDASTKVLKEKNWRFGYTRHILDHVKQSLKSKDGCIDMARAGLASAQDQFKLLRKGQPEISMKEAMEKCGTAAAFDSAELAGEKDLSAKQELSLAYGAASLGVPYYKYKGRRQNRITGLELRQQLDKWGEYGTMEADVVEALKTLQGNQAEWLDLSGMHFVLLGAASAMGPLHFLLSHGATVVAVARSKALTSILKHAKNGPGKVIFPVKKGADWRSMLAKGDYDGLAKVSGCDLLTEAPEIAAWVASVAPGKRLVVGNYTYLDGALHVQVAVACDCIMQHVCKERKDTALAFLGTPTDIHVVTKESAAAADALYKKAPFWAKLWENIGVLKRNRAIVEKDLPILDCVVADQGPNYILSKRLQHWRAVVARADGHAVSSNVSPSTATKSVTSNASFAAAYGGMHIFQPMEVAYQELSLSVMGALLIHDLRNPKSAAQPSTQLEHPLCLFQATSFHGGVWRCPYGVASIGIPSALKYYFTVFRAQIMLGLIALVTTVQYAAMGTVPSLLTRLVATVPAAAWQPVTLPVVHLAQVLGVPL